MRMADSFDAGRADSKKKDVLDQAIVIRNSLNGVINAYYDRTPTSEDDSRDTLAKIRTALIDAERGYSRLADTI